MREYVKVEYSVSVLKEAKDRDFGTRYVISRSQIHILFLATRSRKIFLSHCLSFAEVEASPLPRPRKGKNCFPLCKTYSCGKNFLVSRINSVGRALDCRAEGRGFDTWDRTNTQGLKNNCEMKVLPLPRKWLDLRVVRMTT